LDEYICIFFVSNFISVMVRSDASRRHISSLWWQTVLFSGCVAIVIHISDILDVQFALMINLLFRRYHIASYI